MVDTLFELGIYQSKCLEHYFVVNVLYFFNRLKYTSLCI